MSEALDWTSDVRSPRIVICDVCGRDNADTLTFCQDCGRRLKAQRVVSPTPPNGLPKVDLQAAAAAEPPRVSPTQPDAPSSSSQKSQRSRPEAPVFSFGPQDNVAQRPPPPAPPPPQQAAQSSENVCDACQSPNPVDYKFCVTCGAPLKPAGSAPTATAPSPAIPAPKVDAPQAPALQSIAGSPSGPAIRASAAVGPMQAARPAPPLPEEKIIGAPVVEIAPGGAGPAKTAICARCRGTCVAGTKFCKFCGAPLDETMPSAPQTGPLITERVRAPAITQPATPHAKNITMPMSPSVDHEQALTTREPAAARAVAAANAAAAANAPNSPNVPRPVIPTATSPAPLVIPRPDAAGASGQASVAAPATRGPATPPTVREKSVRGRLVVIVEDGSEGRSFSLDSGQIDIGRNEGDIVLDDDKYVSPRHARLTFEGGRWVVRDLASTNRVYARIRKARALDDGDLLLLGLEVLQFQVVSEAERGLGHASQHGTLLFGSPAAMRRARLCQRTVEGITRDVYHLVRDETVIGRETGDIVFTGDPFLSRRHAAIRRNPVTNEFTLHDLDSSNGTFIAIRGETALANGDFLRIGQHLFRLDVS